MSRSTVHRPIVIFGTLLAMVVGVLATLSPPARAVDGGGWLYGTVRASDGSRLAGVLVDVFASDAGLEDPPLASTLTGDGELVTTGDYEVVLPPGDYRLRYTLDGYAPRWYGLGAGEVVVVEADNYTYLDSVTMSPAADAVIQGVIVDASDNAVDDARVMAFVDGQERPVATARTYAGGGEGHGYFALHVPAGTYDVRFSGPGWSLDYAQGSVAEPVSVAEGESIDLGRLSLEPVSTVSVTGAVTSATDDVDGVVVRLYSTYEGQTIRRNRRTGPTGTYDFDRVPVGARVVACALIRGIAECTNGRPSPHRPGPRVTVPSDVDPVQLPDLAFDLAHARGSVVDLEGAPVPGAKVFFWRVNDDGSFTRVYEDLALEEGGFDRALRRTGREITVCAKAFGSPSRCLGDVDRKVDADTLVIPEVGDLDVGQLAIDPPCQGRVITNGVVSLGVNCLGQLNIDMTGLAYNETGNDSTFAGCPCEGWGVADATTEVSGYANNSSGISDNLQLVDFDVTTDDEGVPLTATSTVQVGENLVITHDYRPSPLTPNAYEVNVSVENISETPADLRYRRVMDWDVEPTPFSEFVTLDSGDAEELIFTSNDGFASADPLAGPSDIGLVGDFTDEGPDDHGALFDFAFGTLLPGEVKTFHTFYGAAGDEAGALDALSAVSAEAYSLGQPSTADGPTLGTPNTFLFAFSGVGGSAVSNPSAVNDSYVVAAGSEDEFLTVLDNDSPTVEGRRLRIISSTQPEHGTVTCDAVLCRYTPDPEFGVGTPGEDEFEYTITDGRGGFATATVALDVTDEGGIVNDELPVIDGSGKVGSELRGSNGLWTPTSGLAFTYRWLYQLPPDPEVEGALPTFVPVPGATSTTFTPTAHDLGSVLVFEVTANQAGSAPVRGRSLPVEVIEADAPVLAPSTSGPSIPAPVVVGRLVTAFPGSWSPEPDAFAYQWLLDGTEVPGATSDSFLAEPGDEGKTLQLEVTTRTPGVAPATELSNAVEIDALPAPNPSSPPVLTGIAATGELLFASPGTWPGSGLDFEYEFQVDGNVVRGLSGDDTWEVGGDVENGDEVRVRVVATKPGQLAGEAFSNTLVIGAKAASVGTPPSIDGTVKAGEEVAVVDAVFTDQAPDLEVTTSWYGSFSGDPDADSYRFFLGEGEDFTIPSWMGGYHLEVEQVASAPGTADVPATSDRERIQSRQYLYGSYRSLAAGPRIGVASPKPSGDWFAYVEDGAGGYAYDQQDGVSETVEWYVDGVVVGTGSTYTPDEDDGGKWLYGYVRGAKDGFFDGYTYVNGGRIPFADEGDATVELLVKRQRAPFTIVPGSDVSVCSDASGCVYGKVGGDGRLTLLVPSRASGTDVRISVTPPYETGLLARTVTTRIEAEETTDLTVELVSPTPTPPGTGLDDTIGSTPVDIDGDGDSDGSFPSVYISDPQTLTVTGCPGIDPATWKVEFSNGVTPMTGTLTEGATAGVYTSTIPGFTTSGRATISTNVPLTCSGVPIEFSLYIDPSGIVADQFGRPIAGARATLLHLDAGAMVPVPDQSVVMSPKNRDNPSFTDSTGFFRWDVAPGTYQVQVSDATSQGAACDVTTTPRMDVPPERVDLLIKMSCPTATKPAPSTAPVLSGTPTVGQTLSVTQGTWSDGIAFERVEWLRDGAVVGTGSTYALTGADSGKKVTARVIARRPAYTQENGSGELVVFDPTSFDVESATVAAAPGGGGGGGGGGDTSTIVNSSKPSVGGTAKVGRTVTANPGTWSTTGLAFAYQWLRDGTSIAGATGADYTAVAADRGTALSVLVTASKAGSTPGTATSDGVTVGQGDAPANQGVPLVTGTPEVGQALSVSNGTWDLSGLTFTYQWLRGGEAIAGATAATYVVTEDDRGSLLTARVTAAKAGHADGTALASGLTVGGEDPEEPSPSTTKATLLGNKIDQGERGEVRVKVTSEGDAVPTGTVTVTVGGRSVEVDLTQADSGKVKVTLPKLKPGRYDVGVAYSGDELTGGSSADAGTLKVREKERRGKGKGDDGKGERAAAQRIGGPLVA